MKMAIYIMLALFLSGMASCGSEDSINPIPELRNPPFDLPRGEEGSLDELIYSVYEKYGSCCTILIRRSFILLGTGGRFTGTLP